MVMEFLKFFVVAQRDFEKETRVLIKELKYISLVPVL